MISMLRTLAHRRDRRPHRLATVERTTGELLFRSELSELKKRLDLNVVELLRQPPESWTGAVDEALLTALLLSRLRRNQLGYYLCGSPALITYVVTALASWMSHSPGSTPSGSTLSDLLTTGRHNHHLPSRP
jgi:ferredoxin-NADP reductase